MMRDRAQGRTALIKMASGPDDLDRLRENVINALMHIK
jgi:hypothetical protein